MTTPDLTQEFYTLTPKQQATAANRLVGWLGFYHDPALARAIEYAREQHPDHRCAWCDKEAGIIAPAGTSHGICARHRAEQIAEAKKLLGFSGTPENRLAESASRPEAKQHGSERGPDSRRSPEPQGLDGQRALVVCGDGRQSAASTFTDRAPASGSCGSRDRTQDEFRLRLLAAPVSGGEERRAA